MAKTFLKSKINLIPIICCVIFSSCSKDKDNSNPILLPLFTNSIVSTDIDFIKSTDPDAFVSLSYIGQEDKEMPDSRIEELFDTNTYIFEASFSNDKIVEIWAHSSFGSEAAAQEYVDKLTPRLGKLPNLMRDVLSRVILHKGDAGAFAEADANFFVIYSDNMDTRISNNDLEETVFHETVHASLDAIHLDNNAWIQAQDTDGVFITEYAQNYPNKEDLAESALFVYTMINYPSRLSNEIENWVTTNISGRFDYIETIFQ